MTHHERLVYLDRIHEQIEKANCHEVPCPEEVVSLVHAISDMEGVNVANLNPSEIVFKLQDRVLREIRKQDRLTGEFESDPEDSP
jgi:hypothetical protein